MKTSTSRKISLIVVMCFLLTFALSTTVSAVYSADGTIVCPECYGVCINHTDTYGPNPQYCYYKYGLEDCTVCSYTRSYYSDKSHLFQGDTCLFCGYVRGSELEP